MKEKENLGVGINVLDRGGCQSTKEDYKEGYGFKKDEIEKWSRIIEMIKATMRGSTDPQMEILLNQIIQQSETEMAGGPSPEELRNNRDEINNSLIGSTLEASLHLRRLQTLKTGFPVSSWRRRNKNSLQLSQCSERRTLS